jgi:hypothetical protein
MSVTNYHNIPKKRENSSKLTCIECNTYFFSIDFSFGLDGPGGKNTQRVRGKVYFLKMIEISCINDAKPQINNY